MSDFTKGFSEAAGTGTEFDKLAELFGGPSMLKHRVSTPIEAHEMILQGIPSRALEKLVSGLTVIEAADAFEKALGISERTFQRHKADHSKTLSPDQSSRAWNFARILSKATAVFGTREEAEKWMIEPAMGLNRWRPIDLLATAAGSELVEQFLERIDYGVYT